MIPQVMIKKKRRERNRKESPSIYLFLSYQKYLNIFDLCWYFYIFKIFHIHSLILSQATPWDGWIITVITLYFPNFPKWDEWRVGVRACVTLPGEGGSQRTEHISRNLPPLRFSLPLGFGYFCPFCVTSGFTGNWDFNIPPPSLQFLSG